VGPVRRRVWQSLRLLVEVVHDLSDRDLSGERDPLPEALDREPAMVAGGICLGVALLAATQLLHDLAFAIAAMAVMRALRHLAATRLRVIAAWALTAWQDAIPLRHRTGAQGGQAVDGDSVNPFTIPQAAVAPSLLPLRVY
jgi:hypothetical protein